MREKLAISLLGLMLVLTAGWVIHSQGNSEAVASSDGQDRVITVTGEAEISAEPDQAILVLGVETSSETAVAATKENAQLTEGLISALEDFGLEDDQINTRGYRVHNYREPVDNRGANYKETYRATNDLQLSIYNLDEVGKIIDLAMKNGANKVNSIQFELRDKEEVKLKALQDATVQAKAKAEAIAEAANINIKGIKTITEEGGSYSPYRADMREMTDQSLGATTPIMPGDVEVYGRVLVEYSF